MLTEERLSLLYNIEAYNYIYEKIFTFFTLLVFTYWLNFFSFYLISEFVYTQECIYIETLLHSSGMFILSIPILVGEYTTKKLILVFTSIIISASSSVILYLVVNSNSWEDKNIPNGCDTVTNILNMIGSTIIGMLIPCLCTY